MEGNAIQHYPQLKVFEQQILNKIAVSEASVERLISRHKQVHSPLCVSLRNDLVTDCLLIKISRQLIEAETTDNITNMILPLYEVIRFNENNMYTTCDTYI